MKVIIKTLFYILVATELLMDSCATSKNLGGEYDDLYYSPLDKSNVQNTDNANIQSKLKTKQEIKTESRSTSVQPTEVKVPVHSDTQIQNPSKLENSKFYNKDSLRINNDQKKVTLSIGVNSRFQSWEISKKSTILTNTDIIKKGMYSIIEEANSETGISYGPEIELFLANIVIRGSYLWGNYTFEIGKVTRKDLAIDFGLEKIKEKWRGGMYVGWRGMIVNYSEWESNNLEELSISDGVFGFVIGSSPNKKGFLANLDGTIGFGIFSGYEGIFLINGQIDIGYRFKTFPIALNAGYGAYGFGKPTGEIIKDFNSFYNKIIESIETQHNIILGPIFKLSYCF